MPRHSPHHLFLVSHVDEQKKQLIQKIQKLFKKPKLGLLLLRVLLGAIMVAHGFPKLKGGSDAWESLGSQLAPLGITFFPVAWGFLAALAEFMGGLLLIFGIYIRVAACALLGVMAVATWYHINAGDKFYEVSHPLALGCVFLALMFIGSGKK